MTANARPTVVLIPGMGNTALLWSAQVDALSADYEVVVPGYEGAESIDAMAEKVLAQIPAASFSLVGFSLGAYIALHLVRRHAERMDRLALISASPFADTGQVIADRERLIAQALENYDGVLEGIGRFIVCPDGPRAREARDAVTTMGRELGVDEFCRQQRVASERPDARELLPAIRVPTLVLCGAEDPVTPPGGNRYLAEHIPGASLQVLEKTGHLLPLERPQEVNRSLADWMQHGDCK